MPRPKTVSDDRILDATLETIGRIGVDRLTFVAVAELTGVSSATIVQRFRNKRELLLAAARHALPDVRRHFRNQSQADPSPLSILRRAMVALVPSHVSRGHIMHHLGFLQLDPEDARFRGLAIDQSLYLLDEVRLLLEAAVAKGELKGAVPRRLAELLLFTWNGVLIQWALRGADDLGSWVSDGIVDLLAPYAPEWAEAFLPGMN